MKARERLEFQDDSHLFVPRRADFNTRSITPSRWRHHCLESYLIWHHWSDGYGRGRLVGRTVQRTGSYVQHMMNMLYCDMAETTLVTQTDISGVARTLSGGNVTNAYGGNALAAADDGGIYVGTGVTAVAIGDVDLVTPIVDGVGAGQLQYGASSYVAPSTAGSTRSFTASRTFTNNSGGTVTIREVGIGLAQTGSYVFATGVFVFLVERTLSTQSILNTASATATYTLGVTV